MAEKEVFASLFQSGIKIRLTTRLNASGFFLTFKTFHNLSSVVHHHAEEN